MRFPPMVVALFLLLACDNKAPTNPTIEDSNAMADSALNAVKPSKPLPTHYPGIDVDIIILKHTTTDHKNKSVAFWQLGTNKKVVAEPIVTGSACRSFGFSVLFHAGEVDNMGIAQSIFSRDAELDVDTSCEALDFSASKSSGSESFLVYRKDVPDYDPAIHKD
ncbi:MAG: hypothetical protein V3U82_03030 [Robiginitomaculum sp.]